MDNVSQRLDKRIALVTGAASGIGRAIATRFVTEGAQVALVDRNAEELTKVREELGAACITVVADVSIEADTARAVSRTVEAFGRLDIAVNSAGVGDGNLIMLMEEAHLENIPLGRVGTPADIAGAAVFLASDDAAWVSGITLFVDGASLTMRYPDVTKILAGQGAGSS